jgi:predicted membrane channel-forming protein YqfA (hemolysin III family)
LQRTGSVRHRTRSSRRYLAIRDCGRDPETDLSASVRASKRDFLPDNGLDDRRRRQTAIGIGGIPRSLAFAGGRLGLFRRRRIFIVERIPYHKAIWHGIVLIAVVLHFAAIAGEFAT